MISTILTGIGDGIASLLPDIAEAIFEAFKALFLTTSTATTGGATTYGLNPLADFALALIVLGLAKSYIPMIVKWFRLNGRKGKRKKARA